MNYSPLVYAANLPKPTINKEIDKVLKAENDVLEESIKKAEANAAITNKKPCTPPKCDISWRSFFRKKNKTKGGGRKHKRRTKRRIKRRTKRRTIRQNNI